MGLTILTGTCSDKLCVDDEDRDREQRRRSKNSKSTEGIGKDRIEELSQKDFIGLDSSTVNGGEKDKQTINSQNKKPTITLPSPRAVYKMPSCHECGGKFQIHNGPMHAYQGVGYV